MRQRFDQIMHPHLDAQFLGQFPVQALLEALALLPLPAGKFPQSPQVALPRTPRNEQPPIAEHQPRRHFDRPPSLRPHAFPRPMLL